MSETEQIQQVSAHAEPVFGNRRRCAMTGSPTYRRTGIAEPLSRWAVMSKCMLNPDLPETQKTFAIAPPSRSAAAEKILERAESYDIDEVDDRDHA